MEWFKEFSMDVTASLIAAIIVLIVSFVFGKEFFLYFKNMFYFFKIRKEFSDKRSSKKFKELHKHYRELFKKENDLITWNKLEDFEKDKKSIKYRLKFYEELSRKSFEEWLDISINEKENRLENFLKWIDKSKEFREINCSEDYYGFLFLDIKEQVFVLKNENPEETYVFSKSLTEAKNIYRLYSPVT